MLAVITLVAASGGILGYAMSRHHAQNTTAPAGRHSAGGSARSSAVRPSSPAMDLGNGTIGVAPGVAAVPVVRPIVSLLTSYFRAVNAHDYLAYRRLLDARMQADLTPALFGAGYRSTVDSGATLTGVSSAADGRATAVVVFTSHQAPADGPGNNACATWTVRLFLEDVGGGYLIGEPPAGYRPSYQPC